MKNKDLFFHKKYLIQLRKFCFLSFLLFPLTVHASFIESTMGAAVVNDATATYFNPAALTLLKTSQIITLGSVGNSESHFTGQVVQANTGFIQSGSSNTPTNYFLPSVYLGIPTTNKLTLGFAVVSNYFNNEIGENSLLRYVQSGNNIQNIDFVPALGIKITEFVSMGAGLNFSYASFLQQPITGFPSLNIPDSQSRNDTNGTGFGGDVGILLRPTRSTLIGFNYRSSITYHLNGKSVFQSNPAVISNNYSFNYWTPARAVLSVNQFFTSRLGMIATIQRIEWSIFQKVSINNIATPLGIINAEVPYHLRDTWLTTLGTYYKITPKWIVRVAASYNQSAGNGNYQIANGDSYIVGASMGYEIIKNIILDGSYAHAFIQNENINITGRNIINGVNNGFLNAYALKVTFNI